jgi:hypothetical protein
VPFEVKKLQRKYESFTWTFLRYFTTDLIYLLVMREPEKVVEIIKYLKRFSKKQHINTLPKIFQT